MIFASLTIFCDINWFINTMVGIFFAVVKYARAFKNFFKFLYVEEVYMLNKVASILFILRILDKKKKNIFDLRKIKIFNVQTINQRFCLIFLE